jgi:hypothetical protein
MLQWKEIRTSAKDRMRGSHRGCGHASARPTRQAGYMHADRFDITNKKLAKGVGSIHAGKERSPRYPLHRLPFAVLIEHFRVFACCHRCQALK